MAKRESKGGNAAQQTAEKPQRYVIPECEIRDFVGSLSILEVSKVAARIQIVADLTSGAFEDRIDELSESDLALIKKIAGEDNRVHYRRLMTAIISGVAEGRHGINSAHLTASRAVEFAFRCTREYVSALHSYRRDLRRLRLVDPSSPSAHLRRRYKTG